MNQQIPSFTINHLNLQSGIYVSMKYRLGNEMLTTFDLRLCRPYVDEVMTTAVAHTIEHLGATYLRFESEVKDKVVYFGPMGCRTGFYLILAGDYTSADVAPLIKAMFRRIADFEGAVPGASAIECGNYTDMDLAAAKKMAKHYYDTTLEHLSEENLNYQP